MLETSFQFILLFSNAHFSALDYGSFALTCHASSVVGYLDSSQISGTFLIVNHLTAVFTATEYSLIWRMLDFLGFPGLALYLILGKSPAMYQNHRSPFSGMPDWL